MNNLRAWLQSESCIPIIDRCIGQLFFSKHPRCSRNRELFKNAFKLKDEELDIDIIRSEFWDYLNNENFNQPDFVKDLFNGDLTKFANKISFRFIGYCKDTFRKHNPWQHYHQHMRDLLSEEANGHKKNFSYKPIRKNDKLISYYAYSDDKNLSIADHSFWGPHVNNNFKDWGIPTNKSNIEKTIHGKDTMLLLAEHFWSQSVGKFNGKYLVPIQQLTNYVFASFEVEGREVESPTDVDDKNKQLEFEDKQKVHMPDYGLYFSEIDRLAYNLVERWEGLQRKIFLKRYRDGIKLQDIEKDGYKSATYHLKKMENSIKELLSLWGFYDVSEEDQEKLFSHFYKKLIEFCEKAEGTVIS